MSDFGQPDFAATPGDEAALVPAVDVSKEDKFAADKERAKAAGLGDTVPFNYEDAGGVAAASSEMRDMPEWSSSAVVYEWDDDFGDIPPRNPDLEFQLYHHENVQRIGLGMENLKFHVDYEGGDGRFGPVLEFADAGLHPVMLENVKLCKYQYPTPIQSYTIPAVLTGHDVVAIAQTGSGKTAAFLIPILSRLMGKAKLLAAPRPKPGSMDKTRAEPLVLVVAPTRELAVQIFDEARRLCYRSQLRPCVIYGGASSREQRENLQKGCDVLIATPGRLMDFMNNMETLSLARLKYTVIDEADELLSEGWETAMETLFKGSDVQADADHQYLMFSATFPKEARKLAREYMEEDFVKIKVGRVGSTHSNIKQKVAFVEERDKNQFTFDYIVTQPSVSRVIVFVNSKTKCDMVDDFLYNRGLATTSLHSGRTQREREDAMRAFRTARVPILIATGVSARGIDVMNVRHIINYDLPSTQHGGITEYVHRIGRTGRIGNMGEAMSYYNDRNEDIAPDLVKILLESKQEIPDFLEQFKPENPENIEWHDGTDDESDAGLGMGGGDFGGGDFGAPMASNDDGFGAPVGGNDDGFGDGAATGADMDDGFGGGETSGPKIDDW